MGRMSYGTRLRVAKCRLAENAMTRQTDWQGRVERLEQDLARLLGRKAELEREAQELQRQASELDRKILCLRHEANEP